MHYTGKLESNGQKFDSSRDRGRPFVFTLGAGDMLILDFAGAQAIFVRES